MVEKSLGKSGGRKTVRCLLEKDFVVVECEKCVMTVLKSENIGRAESSDSTTR
jgi:hypothetical protein